MVHKLKTWGKYYSRVAEGVKPFEVRKNDRDFQVNDIVILQEYDNETKQYTGHEIIKRITYVLHGSELGIIAKDICVFGIADLPEMCRTTLKTTPK